MKSVKKFPALPAGLAAALFAAVLAASGAGVSAAQPAPVQKTAALNNASVSFNGAKTVAVQCYNIEGYNYFRIRDLCKPMNYSVSEGAKINVEGVIKDDPTAVVIYAARPYTKHDALPRLTKTAAQVNLGTSVLVYNDVYMYVQSFKLGGYNYYKVADFASASDYSLNLAKPSSREGAPPNPPSFIGTKVTWDAAARVIHIDKVTTDLLAIYNSIPEGTVAGRQPLPTAPPAVGTEPAIILKDPGKGAYGADGLPLWSNFTDIYRYTVPQDNLGQCTWYAYSRFKQMTGINVALKPNQIFGTPRTASLIQNAANGTYPALTAAGARAAAPFSIAVWNTHVAFVEYVDKDSAGNVTDVYFTECNTANDGVYHPDKDAFVQKKPIADFIASNGGLLGYIMAK